jgi:hypothetical protein
VEQRGEVVLVRMREVEEDALARLDRERDAAILEQVERDVVTRAPDEVGFARAYIRKRIVAVDDAAVVGDQDGVERGRARRAVIATEYAQQNAVLAGEDLFEPLELEARGCKAVGVCRGDRTCS